MKRIYIDDEVDIITTKLNDLNFSKKKQKLDIQLYVKKEDIYDNKILRRDIDIIKIIFKEKNLEFMNKINYLENKIKLLNNKINKYEKFFNSDYSYIS